MRINAANIHRNSLAQHWHADKRGAIWTDSSVKRAQGAKAQGGKHETQRQPLSGDLLSQFLAMWIDKLRDHGLIAERQLLCRIPLPMGFDAKGHLQNYKNSGLKEAPARKWDERCKHHLSCRPQGAALGGAASLRPDRSEFSLASALHAQQVPANPARFLVAAEPRWHLIAARNSWVSLFLGPSPHRELE